MSSEMFKVIINTINSDGTALPDMKLLILLMVIEISVCHLMGPQNSFFP